MKKLRISISRTKTFPVKRLRCTELFAASMCFAKAPDLGSDAQEKASSWSCHLSGALPLLFVALMVQVLGSTKWSKFIVEKITGLFPANRIRSDLTADDLRCTKIALSNAVDIHASIQ